LCGSDANARARRASEGAAHRDSTPPRGDIDAAAPESRRAAARSIPHALPRLRRVRHVFSQVVVATSHLGLWEIAKHARKAL
jgi:hypothetical protein